MNELTKINLQAELYVLKNKINNNNTFNFLLLFLVLQVAIQ